MRVQRAPRAADQPQPAPDGVVRRDRPPAPSAPVAEAERPAVAGAATAASTVEVDLDVTRLPASVDLLAEVVTRLVTECRRAGFVDDGSALRIVAPGDRGLTGARVERAVDQSAHAVASLRAALADEVPATTSSTLTVVDAREVRARSTGDWGLGGGLGVVTLERTVDGVGASAPSAGLVWAGAAPRGWPSPCRTGRGGGGGREEGGGGGRGGEEGGGGGRGDRGWGG